MARYTVDIINGSGSQVLPKGTYTVTAAVEGYSGVLDPSTFTAGTAEGSQAFTIEATGTLTLQINETGAEGGTPITEGAFVRCNQDGSVTYGEAKPIGETGVCTFDHVPFGTAEAPVTFYVRQQTSDKTHNRKEEVVAISMAAQTQSEFVQNTPAALQSFTFADANYSGLAVDGSLTFDGPQT